MNRQVFYAILVASQYISISANVSAATDPSITPYQTVVSDANGTPLTVSVKPWAEVFVDGKSVGISPPLKSVLIAPGTHTITLKNVGYANYTETVEVVIGREVAVVHDFSAVAKKVTTPK